MSTHQRDLSGPQGKELSQSPRRIDKLEANNTWLWRTVAGAIISAGIGALIILK